MCLRLYWKIGQSKTMYPRLYLLGKLVGARPCTTYYISMGNWLKQNHVPILHLIGQLIRAQSYTSSPMFRLGRRLDKGHAIPHIRASSGRLLSTNWRQSPISQLHQRNGQPNSSVQGGVRKTKYRDWAQGRLGRQDPKSPRYLITTR